MLPPKNKIRKRHFQLLEIMVAMFLIVLCAAPALHIYTNMYKQQSEIARDYAADHVVHLVHAQIIERMYKNEISFNDVLAGNEQDFQNQELSKNLNQLGFRCKYVLKIIGRRKLKKEQSTRYLSELTISLTDVTNAARIKNYTYIHFIEGPALQGDVLEEEQDEDLPNGEQAIANPIPGKPGELNRPVVPGGKS